VFIFFHVSSCTIYSSQDSTIAVTGWEIATVGIIVDETVIDETVVNAITLDETVINEIVPDETVVDEIIPNISEISIQTNFFVFALLVLPIALLVITFTKISFSVLRNICIIGILTKIAFIIFVYTQYGKYFIPTIFCWMITAIYIVLCVFTQYCNNYDSKYLRK